MSVSRVYYYVRWAGGGQTNATDLQSARTIAAMIPGAEVHFSHAKRLA